MSMYKDHGLINGPTRPLMAGQERRCGRGRGLGRCGVGATKMEGLRWGAEADGNGPNVQEADQARSEGARGEGRRYSRDVGS
jgi:hypothetical protein